MEIADQLDHLAQRELDEVKQLLATLPPAAHVGLMIEACRCLDHAHVAQLLSPRQAGKLSVHDFDILVRGWNVLLSLLLQRKVEQLGGIPLRESVPELRQAVMGMLHFAGRSVLLRRTAEMLRHGMVAASSCGNEIELQMSSRALSDHFHDQIDQWRLDDLKTKLFKGADASATDVDSLQHLRDVMGKLTFPWKTPHGVMVGYTADPEVDDYFLASVTENTLQWRDEAGIHPHAKLGGCSGELLTRVVLVLMSFYTKHIVLVEEGIRMHAGVNQHMSLTIWKPRAELVNSLQSATGASEQELAAALDLITVRASDAKYFLTEQAPGMPLVIELCDGYVLTPVSGIFRNPFTGIRMLRESTSEAFRDAFREHREEWMARDLYALFAGSRFQRMSGQIKLRRSAKVVTDIDAAIYDNVTGDLVLFQLKWQDFTSSSVRVQRSKAKNFTDRVQDWTQRTLTWVNEFGIATLCQTLKIKLPDGRAPRAVRLIAIGRSNARFRGYGYDVGSEVLAVPWSQFVRLRYTIGPSQDFFGLLEQAVRDEKEAAIDRTPSPYVLERHGFRITFRDIWSSFDNDEDDRDGAVGTSSGG